MGGGGGGNQTTRTEPPKYLQPFLTGAATESRDLYNQGPQQYYPGQTVVGFSPGAAAWTLIKACIVCLAVLYVIWGPQPPAPF